MQNQDYRTKRVPTAFDVEIGARLKVHRIAAGLTLADIANALGIGYQQAQKYEQGLNRISVENLVKFCCYLDIPVDEILSENSMYTLPKLVNNSWSDKDFLEIAHLWGQIKDLNRRKKIAIFIKSVLQNI